jgi:hypothetical protein
VSAETGISRGTTQESVAAPPDDVCGFQRMLRALPLLYAPQINLAGVVMKKLGVISTAVVFSVMLTALALADASPTSGKWRIELSGQALTTGELVFRVTPRQGEATDVAVNIRSGRAENNVAKDVRDALAAKLSPQRYSVEVDDGEDVLIKKKQGQPDFAIELLEANVQNVSIKVEGE